MPEIEEVLPKYLQISGYIRNQIERGELAPGAEVPSERELAASWHVARPTASRALNELRQQGFVESRRGSGTYVVDRSALPAARERGDRARNYGPAYSENESVTVLQAGMVDGPAWVRKGLAVSVGSSVLVRKRLVSNDSGVSELATSWFPAALAEAAPRLLDAERLAGGTVGYVESVTDRRVSYARDRVSARLATADERRHLDLARPSAVLVYRLTLHEADDTVVQFDEVVYPPDRWEFEQEYSTSS
ncbi:GntR family transcriptional regulator [Nocardia sp. GCM10030253]|uniref:GntR family transcriptional regulator n=1 Tax=Nocardia sp. GCM10030253 TaxID=3273404 RepID=UPI00363A41D5